MIKRFRNLGVSWLLWPVVCGAGCADSGPSPGTNTGNGLPTCPRPDACAEPASSTGPDGTTYRGRIYPDVSIASYGPAQAEPDPPVAILTFGGGAVDLSNHSCQEVAQQTPYGVQIYIGADDTSLDAEGTLHVHGAPRDGYYASGPSIYINQEGLRAGQSTYR
jgi:hypothetical protein